MNRAKRSTIVVVLLAAGLVGPFAAEAQDPANLPCDPCASPEAWAALPRQARRELAKHLAALQGARARAAGDRRGEAGFLALQWLAERGFGRPDRNSESLERSFRLLNEAGEFFAAGTVALTLGLDRAGHGETTAAVHDLRAAIKSFGAVREQVVPEVEGPGGIFLALLDIPAQVVGLSKLPSSRPESAAQAGEVLALTVLGEILAGSNRLGAAESEFLRAIELARSLGASADYPARVGLGKVFQAQGRSADARQAFAEALALLDAGSVYESSGRVAMVRLELLVQLAAESLSDRDEAQAAVRLAKIEALLPLVEDSEAKARALGLLAAQAAASERYENSLRYGSQAVEILRRLGLSEPEGMFHGLLAASYSMLFAPDRAARELDQLDDLSSEGQTEALGQALREVLRLEAKGGEALPEVLELMRELAPVVEEASEDWQEMIRILEATLDLQAPEALRANRQGVAGRRGEGGRDLAAAKAYADRLLESARQNSLKTLEMARREGRPQPLIPLLRSLAWAESWTGRYDAALPLLREAVDLIELIAGDTRLDDLHSSFLAEHSKVYLDLVIALTKTGRHEEAFAYSERARARSVLRLLSHPRLNSERGTEPSIMADAEAVRARILDLETQARSAPDPASLAGALQQADAARKELEDLTFRIKLSVPRAADLTQVEPLELGEVQALLAPETTLVSFLVTDAGTHAWIVTRDRFELLTLDVGRKLLTERVAEFRREIASRAVAPSRDRGVRLLDAAVGQPTPPAAAGDELSRRLLIPLVPHLRTCHLILVPHGVLHDLPFAALRHPETGRFLVEDYELSYAPSASALRYLELRSGEPEGRALVLGAPSVAEVEDLPDLGGARREAQRVGRFLGVTPRLGAAATETLLREKARGVDVLHVAAHNVPSPTDPRFSYLALAPDDRHDGKLEMREIFEELDLTGVDLVTLSACETALGERTDGDEVMGLTRALLHAGAGSVLATLWSVDDQASATLMILFYARLQAGESAAKALAEAQRELLASEDTLPPFYWAAFTLVGEPWSGNQQQPAESH